MGAEPGVPFSDSVLSAESQLFVRIVTAKTFRLGAENSISDSSAMLLSSARPWTAQGPNFVFSVYRKISNAPSDA